MQFENRGVFCNSVPEADYECGDEEINHFERRIKLNKHENNVVKLRRTRCSRRIKRKESRIVTCFSVSMEFNFTSNELSLLGTVL
jgi:hypothetical protein